MLKNFFKKRALNKKTSSLAANIWTSKMLDPYKCYYSGALTFRIAKDSILSENQVMIFEENLRKIIEERLNNGCGYISLDTEDRIFDIIAEIASIEDFPENYFPMGAHMSIEEDRVYFYESGMDKAHRVI